MGQSKFRREYSIVAATELYIADYKTYYDENGRLQRHKMLLVGHFHYREGGPPVWARSNGRVVTYFYGRERLLQGLREDQRSRVYYDEPFSFVAGPQDADGMTASRQLGMALVETVVHFVFLNNGYMEMLLNPSSKDMLRLFEIACLSIEPNRRSQEELQRVRSEQEAFDDILASCYMTPPPSARRPRPYPSTPPSNIKYETLSDDDELHKPPSVSRPLIYPSTPKKRRHGASTHDEETDQSPSAGRERGRKATTPSMIKYEPGLGDDDDELYKSPSPHGCSETTSHSKLRIHNLARASILNKVI